MLLKLVSNPFHPHIPLNNVACRHHLAQTGEVRTVMEERVQTHFESVTGWRVLWAAQEVLWYSQRDDWGQLYLYVPLLRMHTTRCALQPHNQLSEYLDPILNPTDIYLRSYCAHTYNNIYV